MLRPLDFARYSAESARWIRSSIDVFLSALATPNDIVILPKLAPVALFLIMRSEITLRAFSASSIPSASFALGNKIANSSPPYRASRAVKAKFFLNNMGDNFKNLIAYLVSIVIIKLFKEINIT